MTPSHNDVSVLQLLHGYVVVSLGSLRSESVWICRDYAVLFFPASVLGRVVGTAGRLNQVVSDRLMSPEKGSRGVPVAC